MSDAEPQLFIDYIVRAAISDVAATVAAPLLSDPLLTRVPVTLAGAIDVYLSDFGRLELAPDLPTPF